MEKLGWCTSPPGYRLIFHPLPLIGLAVSCTAGAARRRPSGTAVAANDVLSTGRQMQRIKALFRARGITSAGKSVYRPADRKEWLGKLTGGSRVRAEVLLRHLDFLLELRPPAKAAMLAEARRQPSWKILRSIPYLGPIRVAEILAIPWTPHRFRTKRNLWPYAGLAVITYSSADKEIVDGQVRKRKRAPMARGLNRTTTRSACRWMR